MATDPTLTQRERLEIYQRERNGVVRYIEALKAGRTVVSLVEGGEVLKGAELDRYIEALNRRVEALNRRVEAMDRRFEVLKAREPNSADEETNQALEFESATKKA